jgi:type I restriction enzyme S subunit
MKQGWEIKRLSEIGKVYNGNSINEKVKKDNYSDLDDGFPYIATKDISYNSEINYENGIKIPFSEKNSFKIAPKNTVLICAEGGSAGRKIGFTNQEVCFGNKLFALAAKNDIESRYVYYYYFSETFQKHFSVELAGIIGGVSMNKFKDLEIPLPSLQEQQRIVAILDEAFAAIAKAKANAEQNLKNSKELFESYLQGVFENPKDNWEKRTLKELTSHLGDGLHGTPKYTSEGDYYFINGNNLTDGVIEFKSSTKRVSFEEYNKHKKNLTDRTILVSINGTLGNVAFYNNEKIILGKSACYFNMKDGIDKNYIKYVLSSSYFLKYAHKEATGATIKNVSLKTMREFIVPLPSLKQQQVIVQNLDALSDETKKLEAIYQQKINDLEELKKSVLQKAFSGELKTEKVIL